MLVVKDWNAHELEQIKQLVTVQLVLLVVGLEVGDNFLVVVEPFSSLPSLEQVCFRDQLMREQVLVQMNVVWVVGPGLSLLIVESLWRVTESSNSAFV